MGFVDENDVGWVEFPGLGFVDGGQFRLSHGDLDSAEQRLFVTGGPLSVGDASRVHVSAELIEQHLALREQYDVLAVFVGPGHHVEEHEGLA